LPTSLLHGIYVASSLHCRGAGTRLIENIEALAHSRGARVLLVKARPEAISFFSARGFGRLATADHRTDYTCQLFKVV